MNRPTTTRSTRTTGRSRFGGRRSGRTILSVLIFLLMFTALLTLVSKYYIMPGLVAAAQLDKTNPDQLHKRHAMAANAMLVLMLMLTLLVMGLLITFRVGRFFFPRPSLPRIKTKVVDAWAEAGKRLEEKSKEEDAGG
jgi:hypothetical protein